MVSNLIKQEDGTLLYVGDGFKITLVRYSDPDRINLARNAALYLGKTDYDNIKRPLSVVKKGHVPEIFRGEHAEFIFEDVSKEVYDHLVTYTTRNMRVAGGNRALTSNDYAVPSDRMKDPLMVEHKIQQSMLNYKDLLASKETRQVARSAMPVGAKMNKFAFQFNFLTLGQSLFKQRLWEKGAQGNTVKVVQGMYELCKYYDEELWDTFYESYGVPHVQWEEVRRKLTKQQPTLNDLMFEIQTGEHSIGDLTIKEYLLGKYGDVKSMW